MEKMIPFNKPYVTGDELRYIEDAISKGKLSGNGEYTRLCHEFFKKAFRAEKVLLTTSCTDALEMCALLLNVKKSDEIIVPSYTFVSTALAFVREGATIRFADSRRDHPGIDENSIENLINKNTKAIVVVHYAGVACDMDKIIKLADKYNLYIIEDAAQAIDSFYINEDNVRIRLGSIGHLSTFSFHETKNIQSGEGGLLVINDSDLVDRAEIIWEKGTNRAEFFRGEVNKYGWVDVGSSFLPSEITAAFLWAQLQELSAIQNKRKELWNVYYDLLADWAEANKITLPYIPKYATNNAHMFYLICKDHKQRSSLIEHLKRNSIMAVFHYLSLHKSKYYWNKHDGRSLPNSDLYTERLVRLPLFVEMSNSMQIRITKEIMNIH